MVYGTFPQKRLPRQNADLILLMADRFERAAASMQPWAEKAKECVEFFEGKQWSDADLQVLLKQRRPPLTLNKIKPLVQLVLGYHLNNRTDFKALPGTDGSGTADIAEALNQVFKQVGLTSQLQYVDAEVFMDGLTTGRGFYDTRLDFAKNDLGEIRVRAQDPFATYLCPDADTYSPDDWPWVMTSKMISIDEVDVFYGLDALTLIEPLVRGGGTFTGIPNSYFADSREEVTPFRRFGGEVDGEAQFWQGIQERFFDVVDFSRKTVRLIDMQHKIRTRRQYFVDLETGDREAIPDHWDAQKIAVVEEWAKEQGAPLQRTWRIDERIAWTHMVGDVIVYNEWSPYEKFTITPFFPYWRRGQTRGMVHDLVDPQREINKRRSARLNIVMRAANGGWAYAKGTLDAWQRDQLEEKGSSAGFHLEWDSQGGKLPKPEQISPPTPPEAMKQLEHEAEQDLKEISGVNDSALGQIEKVQSGRAIEAKQRQTVVGMEQAMSNYSRSKILLGENLRSQVQQHYTERRVIRIINDQGQTSVTVVNDRIAASGAIVNNLNLGKYSITVDETPLSASFLEGVFEELLRMKSEAGIPVPTEWIVDASSVGRKDELKQAITQAEQQAPQKGDPDTDPRVLQNKKDIAIQVAQIKAAADIEAAQISAKTDIASQRAEVEMHSLEIAEGVGRGAPVNPNMPQQAAAPAAGPSGAGAPPGPAGPGGPPPGPPPPQRPPMQGLPPGGPHHFG